MSPNEKALGGNRGLESQEKQPTMTTQQTTAPAPTADMGRTRCPQWCESRSTSRQHSIAPLPSGGFVATHRGTVLVNPDGFAVPLELWREVQWTHDGELILSADGIMLPQTYVCDQSEVAQLVESLQLHGRSLPESRTREGAAR